MIQLIFFFNFHYISCTDDDREVDAEPPKDYMRTFNTKLRDLACILADVYLPSEAFRINEKLADIGCVSLFVSYFHILLMSWNCCKLD